MNKLKRFAALALSFCTAISLAACGGNSPSGDGDNGDNANDNVAIDAVATTPITTFTDNSDSNNVATGFNKNLWYRNDLKLDMGDPMLVFDEDTNTFYALGTRGGTSFEIFESQNLSDWTIVQSGGFYPSASSWGRTSLWAPDIQKIDGKYYLYYTANYVNANGESHCQLGVAVSDYPQGPYMQWTGVNAYGKTIGERDLPFYGLENSTVLDSHVFEDDDGELYMYFSYDTKYDADPTNNNGTAEIWGVKMVNPTTWEMDEVTGKPKITRLISAGYKTLDGANKNEIPWEVASPSFNEPMECVEGPYMIKNNGKYYLTYCANSFVDMEYAVGYAESDSPLGPFVKPNDTYLQNMICGVPTEATGTYISNRYIGFMTGTGHASVCKVGDEYLLAYHAHMNRDKWGVLSPFIDESQKEWRAIGFDYIHFGDDGRPYSNGPTYSLQKLPDAVTGYTNLAPKATVYIDGSSTNQYCAYINDSFTNRAFNTAEVNKEAQFSAGKHKITLKFEQAITIKAVNIYNSYDRTKSTDVISRIDFGTVGYIGTVRFNQKYLVDTYSSGSGSYNMNFIYPHSAYNVELTNKGVTTDTVTVTIECDHAFAIGEIEILGK